MVRGALASCTTTSETRASVGGARARNITSANIQPPMASRCAVMCASGVERAPQIPSRHGPVRPPSLSPIEDLTRGGQGLGAKHFLKPLAHAVVGRGEHVGATESKDEQHLHRPG